VYAISARTGPAKSLVFEASDSRPWFSVNNGAALDVFFPALADFDAQINQKMAPWLYVDVHAEKQTVAYRRLLPFPIILAGTKGGAQHEPEFGLCFARRDLPVSLNW